MESSVMRGSKMSKLISIVAGTFLLGAHAMAADASPDPLNRASTPLIDRVAPGWGDVILLLGRILIGGIFVQSGFDKLMGLDAFAAGLADRKSTRLNSSHLGISYAVFCL